MARSTRLATLGVVALLAALPLASVATVACGSSDDDEKSAANGAPATPTAYVPTGAASQNPLPPGAGPRDGGPVTPVPDGGPKDSGGGSDAGPSDASPPQDGGAG